MNLITRDPFFWSVFNEDFKYKKDIMKSDVYEEDGDCVIEIDIPGFKKENVAVEYEDGYLTVTAKSEIENEDSKKNYIKRERYYDAMSRSYYIGEVVEESINAKFEDGILKMTFPKESQKSSLKQIPIN